MWEELTCVYESLPLSLNRREEISGVGVVLGAVTQKATKCMCVHSVTKDHGVAVKRIIHIWRQIGILPECEIFNLHRHDRTGATRTP